MEKRLSVPVEDRPAHYELLPPGPIGNGSTVEEVVHFFEAFRAFMSAEWNQDD